MAIAAAINVSCKYEAGLLRKLRDRTMAWLLAVLNNTAIVALTSAVLLYPTG